MTFKEAKPYLKVGMKIKCLKPRSYWGEEWNHFPIQRVEAIEGDCAVKTEYARLHGNNGVLDTDDGIEILTEADGVTPWVKPGEAKFKVGDRVKSIHWMTRGEIGVIIEKSEDAGCWIIDGFTDGAREGRGYAYLSEYLEKIEDEPKPNITSFLSGIGTSIKVKPDLFADYNKFEWNPYIAVDMAMGQDKTVVFNYINEAQPQKKGLFMRAVDKIKKSLLSAVDSILRKEELEDENGKMTEEARETMHEELIEERWAKRRTEIAEALIKIDAEEKK